MGSKCAKVSRSRLSELRKKSEKITIRNARKLMDTKEQYACDFECGFTGCFAEVLKHEQCCPKALRTMKTMSGDSAKYACDFGCGFCGSFDEVKYHEAVCKNATA